MKKSVKKSESTASDAERQTRIASLLRDRAVLVARGQFEQGHEELTLTSLAGLMGCAGEPLSAELATLVDGGHVALVEYDDEPRYRIALDDPEYLAAVATAAQRGPTLTRYLECVLTHDDIQDMRSRREILDAEGDALEDRIEAADKALKAQKKSLEVLRERSLTFARTIRDGHEMRDVECYEQRTDSDAALTWDPKHDGVYPTGPARQIVVTIRRDTGDAVEWRELRANERQGALFDEVRA